jgi:hypothetical protein
MVGCRRRRMSELDELTAQLLARHGPDPAWLAGGRDRLKEAWDSCDDVAAMIAFLRAAAEVGAVAIDGYTEWSGTTGVSRWLFRLRSGEVWYRVDVRPADGGDGVRRCFPDFPGTEALSELLRARLAKLPPLERLVLDLRAGRVADDLETSREVWRECDAPWVMLQVLRLCGASVDGIVFPPPSGGLLVPPSQKRAMCDAIRDVHPELPVSIELALPARAEGSSTEREP